MTEQVDLEVESNVPIRLRSAAGLLAEISEHILKWSLDHVFDAPVRISPQDSGMLEVIFPQPEVQLPYEWSTKFGHAVHDLRSALDHLVQQLCRLNGEEPKNPRQVQFPIAGTGNEWRNAKRALSSMPNTLLTRIENLQPYRSNGELAEGLYLLNRLAVLDKHYELTRLLPLPTGISLDMIKPWPEDSVDELDWDTADLRLHVSPAPGDAAKGMKGIIPVHATPALVLDERMSPLLDVMPWLFAVTQTAIDTITLGDSDGFLSTPLWITLRPE